MAESPPVAKPGVGIVARGWRRTLTALLLGGLGLAGAAFTPAFAVLDNLPLHFIWSLMFPAMAAVALGARGGIIAVLAGPALAPFLLWPGGGWGTLTFPLACVCFMGWVGYCAERRVETEQWWNHPAIAPLPAAAVTLVLYETLAPALALLNPLTEWGRANALSMPMVSIVAVAVKQVFSLCFAMLAARCALKLPAVRRVMGLRIPTSHRFNNRIIAGMVLLMVLLSGMVLALGEILVGTAGSGLVHSPYELISLLVMAAVLMAGALACCAFVEQQVAAADHLRSVEQRFDLAMQGANDGLMDWSPPQHSLYLSPRWLSMLGYGADDLPARTSRILHPDDRAPVLQSLKSALKGSADRIEMQYRAAHKDGGYRHMSARAMILRDQDQHPSRVIGTQRDVTEIVEAAQRQRQAEAVFNTTLEGVVVADGDGNIVAANPAFLGITGFAEAELSGKSLACLDAEPDSADGIACFKTMLAGQDHWQGNVWLRPASGEVIPQWLTISVVRDQYGKAINYVGVFTDITAIRKNAAQMEYLAHHDPLTNLPNRLLLKSRISHACDLARRRNGMGAVLFIDLDHFKQVNDTLGHRCGDELLQQLVLRMRHRLRESDTLARLGGDEFVAVLEDVREADDAALVAVNLIEQAKQPFMLTGGHEVKIGCSVGISLFPEDGSDADTLLHHADLALYQAKEEGRGRHCFHNLDHGASSQRRLTSNAALKEALTSGGLELYFQPVVSLIDGKVHGTEALLRWRDPQGRVLTPDKFMPMAENTALMMRIGDWVLKEACRTMKGWIDEGLDLGSMTVNLSMNQFKAHDLPQRIGNVLRETGLDPRHLELDITEAAVMPRGDDPLERLRDLKSLGLQVALDDFGTGYSSFAKLGQYPVDKIKVDRKFVHEIDGTDGGTAAAIVAMANLLQIPVQAEGIETEWQREVLLRSHCASGQGYLFSRPMPKQEFRTWFGNNQVH